MLHGAHKKSLTACMILAALAAAVGARGLSARAEVIESIVARVNDDIISQSELAEAEGAVIEEIYAKSKGEALQKELARAKNELLRDRKSVV